MKPSSGILPGESAYLLRFYPQEQACGSPSSSGVWLPFQISRDRRLLPIFHQNAWSCASGYQRASIRDCRSSQSLPRPSAWPRQEPAGGGISEILFRGFRCLEHERNVATVRRPQLRPGLADNGAFPGEGIGPGPASSGHLRFQHLVCGHTENEVALHGREQFPWRVSPAGLAVPFHQIRIKMRGTDQTLRRVRPDVRNGPPRVRYSCAIPAPLNPRECQYLLSVLREWHPPDAWEEFRRQTRV